MSTSLTLRNLAHPRPLASTLTSDLYTVEYQGQKAVLKLLKDNSDEHRSAIVLRYFDGQGSVRLYEAKDNALLLEYLEGPSLASLVKAGQDTQATEVIADVVAQLHAPRRAQPPLLPTLENHFHALFVKAEQEPTSIYARGAAVACDLLSTQTEQRVLHGDIHHDNILHSARGWVAIDPKGIIGDPAYEVANAFMNPLSEQAILTLDRMHTMATTFARRLNMDQGRILRFAFVHACLAACWFCEDGVDPTCALSCANLLEPLIAL